MSVGTKRHLAAAMPAASGGAASLRLPAGSGGAASLRLEDLFKALAEPRRLAILRLVHDRELPAGEIAEHFQTTRQAISQHLGVLATVGLLHLRREGTKRLYRANADGIDELRASLDAFWDDSLSSLKREIARDRQHEPGGRS